MKLNQAEQVEAVRLMLGKIRLAEIADRLGIHVRYTQRIIATFDTVKCPLCRQNCWHAHGILAKHVCQHDSSEFCPMSGIHHQDEAAAYLRRGWLNGRETNSSRRARRRKAVSV